MEVFFLEADQRPPAPVKADLGQCTDPLARDEGETSGKPSRQGALLDICKEGSGGLPAGQPSGT